MFRAMIESSQKLKNKNDIKILKKSKIAKILIGIALFSVITVSTASLFYSTQVSPKINEITKTINENKQYLSSIPDSIFNDVYSDKDFNDDIKLFDRIHKTLTIGKNSKEMNEKKISFLFITLNRITYLNMVEPTVSYDRIYEGLLVIPSTLISDVDNENNKKIRDENYKFMHEKFGNKGNIPALISNGLFPPTNSYYNDIIKEFNLRYKDESYIKAFMVNGSEAFNIDNIGSPNVSEKNMSFTKDIYAKQTEEMKSIQKDIEEAYINKDYKKLKMYFKQQREFFKYIAGLNIGNNKLSPYYTLNSKENNLIDMVKMGLIYKTLKIKDATNKDAIENIHFY